MGKLREEIARVINEGLQSLNLRIEYSSETPPWERDERFRRFADEARKRSLLGVRPLYMLYQAVRMTAQVPGDIAELGVSRGGTSLLLARSLATFSPEKRLHLFDSFQGLPSGNPTLDGTVLRAGDLACSQVEVESFLRNSGATNWAIHPGWFDQTLPTFAAGKVDLSLLHLDCDFHQSTRIALETLFPHLSPGGALILDDYGNPSTPGVRRATEEFLASHRERSIYLATGQAMVFKLSGS